MIFGTLFTPADAMELIELAWPVAYKLGLFSGAVAYARRKWRGT